MKPSITPAERLQLIGLAALGQRYDKLTKELEEAALDLLGVVPDDKRRDAEGHVSDMVYANRDPDEMLQILGIRVEEEKQA